MSAFEQRSTEGLRSMTCALDGVNCAGCIAGIERGLSGMEGLVLARGNATTKRMRLVWDETQTSADVLIEAIRNLGYGAHPFDLAETAERPPSLLGPLAVAGFSMLNIMAISVSVWIGVVSDMGGGTMAFMHWIAALLSLPAVFYSGQVFYGPALTALRHGRMTMDTPIALAIIVTFAASLFETVRGHENVYYDAVVALIFFLLIGRVLDHKLRQRSGTAAENLRAMLSVTARRLDKDGEQIVPADHLVPGDRVLITAGEQIPADGVLIEGPVSVDESPLTGESVPRVVSAGEALAAGCTLLAGPAQMDVTHVGADAQLGRLAMLAEEAAAHKGRMQELADSFARGYVPTVLIGGLLGFSWWYLVVGASFGDALMIAVAVLVVTCPCAAGLATPAVTARAVDVLMQKGIILKSGRALEQLALVDRIYADKTGTLTTAKLRLDPNAPYLREAAALAATSAHPLAQALSEQCKVTAAQGVTEHAGQGLSAQNGARLGAADFVGAEPGTGGPEIWYRPVNGEPVRFCFDEEPRDGLRSLLADLDRQGISMTILSGDKENSVSAFARAYGIKNWRSAQSPQDKLAFIQAEGGTVLMIGDGINDAAALSAAQVSASFAQATQVAQISSDVVLLVPDLSRIMPAIHLARDARRLILQNLRFATVYNLVTVPLALAGWLSPLIAAALMSSSSVIVLANGLRLRMKT